MGLLAEYAVTPDVFDTSCYTSSDLCGARLQGLKDAFLEEGIVRDLRNGEWRRLFAGSTRPWHRRAKELLRKLITYGRLAPCPPVLPAAPTVDSGWCDEALATHEVVPLSGVIVSDSIAWNYRGNALVSSVNRLAGAPWWAVRGPSLRLNRRIEDYEAALALVLRHANSVMFIDANIDPGARNYADFARLIQGAGNRSPCPRIEIHRKCQRGSGRAAAFWDRDDLEDTFRQELSGPLSAVGLTAEVFVWDDMHDRYLISDLVGISVPYGFDTSTSSVRTTWTRLGRADRDDVQREFDPASGAHKLLFSFTIP